MVKHTYYLYVFCNLEIMETEHINVPRLLAVLPLFMELSPQDLERVAQGCAVHRWNRGDVLFYFGAPCEEFHVVISGQVKLFALSPSGQEKVIEIMGPNSTFAEALVFLNKPHILNAQALSNLVTLSIKKHTLISEIERDPRFATRMLAGLSRRLHGLVHDVKSCTLKNGVQRVIGYLLSDHDTLSHDENADVFTVALPVSKATIASRLSLTPEYFSKVLRELEDAGLIQIDKRDIHVVSAHQLMSYGLR